MKTDSHQPTEGRETTRTDDNVVRLPREWLGPREDLVQFDVANDPVAAPPAPEDFWGEGSSELQSALVGTPVVPATADTRAAPASHRPRRFQSRRPWPARIAAVGAASAALILAGVVISALGGHRIQPPHTQVAALSHSTDAAADSGLLRRAPRHVSVKPSRVHRVRAGAHRRVHVAHRHSPKPPPAASGTTTLVASSYSPSSSVVYGGSSSASSTGAQIVSSGGAQAASAQSSQPAFGQNGSLGPGRGAPNTQ